MLDEQFLIQFLFLFLAALMLAGTLPGSVNHYFHFHVCDTVKLRSMRVIQIQACSRTSEDQRSLMAS